MSEGCWVGLDVHARSVIAGVIDQGSGEARSLRLPPGGEATVVWLEGRGKPRSIVMVAVARELAGHCWALATMK